MPALLTLLACEGPARFPSPELAGRGVAPTWVWVTEPDLGYEVALPRWPSVVRAEDGEIAQLGATEGPASFSLSVSAPVAVAAREARLRDTAAARLETLGVNPTAVEPWDGLAGGRTFFLPNGELRAGWLGERLVLLVASGGGAADRAFLDSFAPRVTEPTRIWLPGTDRRMRCPVRCGPATTRVVLGGAPVEVTGLAGMVGTTRFRAVGARGEGAREGVLAALVGEAVLVEEGEIARYRAGSDTLLVRVVEVGDEAAAAVVMAAEPPAWAEGTLRSLE